MLIVWSNFSEEPAQRVIDKISDEQSILGVANLRYYEIQNILSNLSSLVPLVSTYLQRTGVRVVDCDVEGQLLGTSNLAPTLL